MAGVEIIWERKERGYKSILDMLVGAKDGGGEREYCDGFKTKDTTVVSPHNKSIFPPFQGKLHFTERSCALVLKHDFDYWGVDEMMLEPCCALKYYPEMEVCSKEQEGERRAKRRMQVRTRDFPKKCTLIVFVLFTCGKERPELFLLEGRIASYMCIQKS